MRRTLNLPAGHPCLWVVAMSMVSAGTLAGETAQRDAKDTDGVLLFCSGSRGNDLFRAATEAAGSAHAGLVQHSSVDGCAAAATALPIRSGVLVLADGAPAVIEQASAQTPAEISDRLAAALLTCALDWTAAPAPSSPAVSAVCTIPRISAAAKSPSVGPTTHASLQLPQPLLDVLSSKDIRLYVEFAALPAGASVVGLDQWPCPTYTRVVAAPGSPLWTRPGSAVKPLDLFEPNACRY